MNFDLLTNTILETHTSLQQSAVKAINIHLTIRNWLIGFYIVEFEQKGEDRAKYGSKLLPELAKKIKIKGLTSPELSRCRQFYHVYPQIFGIVSQKLDYLLPQSILGLPTQELQTTDNQDNTIYFEKLLTKISYTNFVEIIKIKDENKRKFYELLVIKNTLSVEELKRQIATLAYERVGLSQNGELAFSELSNKITPEKPTDAVKSIYLFDFMDLPNAHLIEESELEDALINHLTQFMLEMGNGFCFEARQKRLLIDDEYYFVDLVFYHRLLKCHVLIELKTDKFKHEHLSQLNTYVACYNDQIKQPDDNPTIGILLCTEKGKQLVEYALAGMDNNLFVSKYLLNLPSKEILTQFIENELKTR
jgi:predicted nuclease of restriction endonuclease-like (RecB) superfamily